MILRMAGTQSVTDSGLRPLAYGQFPLETCSVTGELMDFVGSATLVAVMVMFCWPVIEAGAVYTPAVLIFPTLGLIAQVTDVFGL
jgi:hypothetical protein